MTAPRPVHSGAPSAPVASASSPVVTASAPVVTVDALRLAAHEVLAEALRRRILLGDFPPGARLPSERELALSLGASRNTIREAIRLLAAEGLVTTRRGRGGGTVVAAPNPATANGRRLTRDWRTHIDNAYEYRLTIEPAAASLAATRGTAAQRLELERRATAQPTDLGSYHRADSRLHLLVAKMCGNPLLEQAIVRAREDSFREINLLWLHGDDEAAFDDFAVEHRDLADAILAGDPATASAAMTAHLVRARDQFTARAAAVGGSRPPRPTSPSPEGAPQR